jgi:hypothetical protein
MTPLYDEPVTALDCPSLPHSMLLLSHLTPCLILSFKLTRHSLNSVPLHFLLVYH